MYHETQCGCGQYGYGEEPGIDYSHRKWRGHHGYPGGGGLHHGSCCCCHHGGGMHHGHGGMLKRCFTSKEEIVAKLEEYLKQLQSEARGVEEHIAELKKEC